jgi:hypothetical protein
VVVVDRVEAVIEDAGVYKIGDLFTKKPPGLRINETDAIVVTAKAEGDKRVVTRTFYFCLKPDGTFYEESIARNGSRARRHRLASFLRHYKIAEDVKRYNIKEKISDWRGVPVQVVPIENDGIIYVP